MRLDLQDSQEEKDVRESKTDAYFKQLLDATPAQAEQWVLDNIDSLPKARTLLAKLVKYVVARERRG